MDLSKCAIKIAGDIAPVPGLSALAALLIIIIDHVQECRDNKERLQFLVHSITELLSSIALQMEGRWDDALPELRTRIDEYEIALQDVLRTVASFNRKGKIVSFLTSTSRSLAITRLEDHMGYLNNKISVWLDLNTAMGLEDTQNVMTAQHEATEEILSALVGLQNLVTPNNLLGENNGRTSEVPV